MKTSPVMLERARELRKEMTPAEKRLWPQLRDMKQADIRFRRQVIFNRYIVDFASHSAKLVVELDGDSHGSDKAIRSDEIRDAYLRSRGYRVLRFSNQEVHENLEAVAETIYRAALPPPLTPPREGEGNTLAPPSPSRGRIEDGGQSNV